MTWFWMLFHWEYHEWRFSRKNSPQLTLSVWCRVWDRKEALANMDKTIEELKGQDWEVYRDIQVWV
jgi:hypothetical protein